MSEGLERFYSLVALLKTAPCQSRLLGQCTGRTPWPRQGVYFFFEPGEHRRNQLGVPRVVRVGTHAVSSGSKSTLWSRLRAHRGDRSGGGNHRGSIFRLHVGAAMLAARGEVMETWASGSSAARSVCAAEAAHEQRVSGYIRAMSVLWVAVPGEAGPTSERAFIEKNAIGMLSNRLAPHDPPTAAWLGRFSPRVEVARSGLWNINHVRESYTPTFLDRFEELVWAMLPGPVRS